MRRADPAKRRKFPRGGLFVEEGVAEELGLVARYPHHGHIWVEAGGLGCVKEEGGRRKEEGGRRKEE